MWLEDEGGARANLRWAYLRDADLRDADLIRANLRGANLRGAENIPDYVFAGTTIAAEGDLIVYKKLEGGLVATLRIPTAAKRSNATGRKCRAEYAEVLKIESIDGKTQYQEGVSERGLNFYYRVGETVYPDSYDENRWDECSHGIHFFLTRYEAEIY